MKKLLLLLFCSSFILFLSCSDSSLPVDESGLISFDEVGARGALIYINYIRSKPDSFSDSTGFDLSNIPAASELRHNDTLNAVAYNKAKDMIRRNYYSNVDPDGNGINILMHNRGYKLPNEWIITKSMNSFESLDAGLKGDEYYAREFVNRLIRDENSEDKINRNRILGIGDFNKDMTDFGCAIARKKGSEHENYFVLIIAKKK